MGIYDPDAHWFTVYTQYGDPVPHQFKVLARWGGTRDDTTKPVKWVLITFNASVPPNTTRIYRLGHGLSSTGSLQVVDNGTDFTILPTPGTAIHVNKSNASLFSGVTVDGQTVVSSGGGIRMKNALGNMVQPVVTETVLEEAGDVRAVIHQKGTLGNLEFSLRYTFHAGQKNAIVDFRLVNRNPYGHFGGITPGTEYFDFLKIWLPVSGSAATVTNRDTARSFGNSPYRVLQDYTWTFNNDLEANFHYDENIANFQVGSGNVYREGSIDLRTSNGGVTAVVDRFWQNFPKAFNVVNGNELEVALWPDGGHGPEFRGNYATPSSPAPIDPMALDFYRFEGGRQKVHRMMFDFHTDVRNNMDVRRIGDLLQIPLVGRTTGKWFARSFAHGKVLVERKEWASVAPQRFEALTDVLTSDANADPYGSVGKVGLPGFRNRGGRGGGVQWYGWDNYGDFMWTDGPSSLHYDWPQNVLLAWARGGDYGFFDVGRDMAAHRRDYDHNHSNSTVEFWRGAQFYEKGWWHGNNSTGRLSHTWIGGLLLNYALTGDEFSREAALESLDFILRYPPRNWNGLYGSRIPGWSIENLVDAYTYLGDPMYLSEAGAGVARFEELEGNWGSQGYVMNASTGTPFCQPFMHSIFFCAAARYTLLSGDPSYLPLLHRMKTFLGTTVNMGTGPMTAMTVPTVDYLVYDNGTVNGSHRHHSWYLADVYSLSALIFANQADADIAEFLFNVSARFHQEATTTVVNYYDPATFSINSMWMPGFPGTESKVMAGIMSHGLSYMALHTLQGGQ